MENLDKLYAWLTSDVGWKTATAIFFGCVWIRRAIKHAAQQVKNQINNLIVPLEEGLRENRAEVAALTKSAQDQNGANEKAYATKEFVRDFVTDQTRGLQHQLSSVDDNVKSLVTRIDTVFSAIMNNRQ